MHSCECMKVCDVMVIPYTGIVHWGSDELDKGHCEVEEIFHAST